MEFTKYISNKILDIYRRNYDYWEVKRELGIPISELRPFIESIRFSGVGQWWFGLSYAARRSAEAVGVRSRDELMNAYLNGRLSPGERPRLYGWKTHKEVAKWLGLPEPFPGTKKFNKPKIEAWNAALQAAIAQIDPGDNHQSVIDKIKKLRK